MPARRSIKSYVSRQGRLTKAQADAVARHWDEFGIEYRNEPLDLAAAFGRTAPTVLDVGSGMGEATLALAQAHPDNNYLAVEVHKPGIGRLLHGVARHGLANVRVVNHDVVDVVARRLPEQSLAAAYIHFPDPWPKKRHHKRRLVSPGFVRALTPRLGFEARLYLATDSQDLAEHMLAVCDAEPALINLAGRGRFCPRPHWRPLTKFEQRGLAQGNPAWNLAYCRSLD